MSERRLLVTGATGFVGRWVLRHWRAEHPRTRLVATSHLPEPAHLPCDRYARIDLRDREAVRGFVAESRPDAVVHLAGIIASDDLHEQLSINVEATENLYRALLECPHPADVRVVQVGSAAMYGAVKGEELPISEAKPFRPLTPYGLSKAAQDHLAYMVWRRSRLPIIRARVFNLLGPGQPAQLVPMTFLTQLAGMRGEEGQCLRVGDTSARRDYVDVRDAAAAFDALLERGEGGQAYNVASARPPPGGGRAMRPSRRVEDPPGRRLAGRAVSEAVSDRHVGVGEGGEIGGRDGTYSVVAEGCVAPWRLSSTSRIARRETTARLR